MADCKQYNTGNYSFNQIKSYAGRAVIGVAALGTVAFSLIGVKGYVEQKKLDALIGNSEISEVVTSLEQPELMKFVSDFDCVSVDKRTLDAGKGPIVESIDVLNSKGNKCSYRIRHRIHENDAYQGLELHIPKSQAQNYVVEHRNY